MTTNIMQQSNAANSPVLATKKISTNESEKYRFLSSDKIKNFFINRGYDLEGTSQVNPRLEHKKGYQKHIMIFSKKGLMIDDENKLQILVTNSHDGSSALKLNLGVFRIVCANGLVAGDDMYQQTIRHQGKMIEQNLEKSLNHIVAHASQLKEQVKKMKETVLSSSQKIRLAENAINIRLKGIKNIINIDMFSATKRHRSADNGQDLYTFFNVLQENCIRGGIEYKKEVRKINKETKEVTFETRQVKTRGITEVKRSLELNKALWNNATALLAA